ncbi:MAG: DUF4891 domain-containing protein [Bacteroides sp.]|nr:DUF4891 domain-containing protein [Bacteroides sp.]
MKKTFLVCLLAIFICYGCTFKDSRSNTSAYSKEAIGTDTFPRPTFILRIDINKEKTLKGKLIRNVKAKVHIDHMGKVTVLQYAKEPEYWIKDKIARQLVSYRVTPKYIEEGKIKLGVNYVFLRFVERDLDDK